MQLATHKWKGWDQSFNLWIPEYELSPGVAEYVDAYELRLALFYDVATKYMVVYPLRSKDENTTATKRFCADLRAYGGDTIKRFHSDNGGEYTGKEYCEMITNMGQQNPRPCRTTLT